MHEIKKNIHNGEDHLVYKNCKQVNVYLHDTVIDICE